MPKRGTIVVPFTIRGARSSATFSVNDRLLGAHLPLLLVYRNQRRVVVSLAVMNMESVSVPKERPLSSYAVDFTVIRWDTSRSPHRS